MKFDSIIHIGCEKTGSTALQTALSVIGNDKLRLHGFKYIRPRLPEYSETDSSLAAIISLLRPDRLKYYLPTNTWSSPIDQVTQESEILLRRELKTASLENAAPILSSELFSSRFDTEEIERLKELMTSMDFHKPLILCYFRDPIETACSWISTRVKYGEWIDGCKLEYVAHEDLGLILGYNDVIRRWSSVFSESSFFSFSYDSQNGNIIEHFCSACIGSIFGCTDWPALRDELVRHLRRNSLDAKNKKLNLVNMYIINHLNSFFHGYSGNTGKDLGERQSHSEMIQGRIRKLIESLFTLSSLFGANYPEFTLDKTDESIIRTSYHDSIRTYQAHRDAECHRLSEETQFISSEIDSSPFLVKEPTETSSSTTNDNHQLTAIQAEQVEHIKSSLFALMDYISKYTN